MQMATKAKYIIPISFFIDYQFLLLMLMSTNLSDSIKAIILTLYKNTSHCTHFIKFYTFNSKKSTKK